MTIFLLIMQHRYLILLFVGAVIVGISSLAQFWLFEKISFIQGEKALINLETVYTDYLDHLLDSEPSLYNEIMIDRLEKMLVYLEEDNKIIFRRGNEKYNSMMYVLYNKFGDYVGPEIYVPNPDHQYWQDQTKVDQAVSNELSHIVFKTLDISSDQQIEEINVEVWPYYSDWYEILVMWYHIGGVEKIDEFVQKHL